MSSRSVALGGALLLALACTTVACSDDDSVFNAEVGECVKSVSDLSGQISDLPEAPCTESHEGEILFLFEHQGDGPFPGSASLHDEAQVACEGDEFESYTGTTYAASAIVIDYITPTEQSWGQGDRETICVATTNEAVTESFKDNGDDFPLGG